MKNAKVVALALCLLFLVGCASSVVKTEVDREYKSRHTYIARVGNWFVDRFNDVTDVGQVSLSFGPSWPLINVHASEFAQLGMGSFVGTRVGMQERAFGVWEESRQEYGIGPYYHISLERIPTAGLPRIFDHAYDYTGWDLQESEVWKEDMRHWADLGGTLHLFFVGADLNFSTMEAVDAVLGLNPIGLALTLVGYYEPFWDIEGDDDWNQVRDELEAEGLGE